MKSVLVGLACAALLAGCASRPAAPTGPLACDDGIKTAFRPDALTTVVAVRDIRKGTPLIAVDSPSPIVAATDMCLVKLLVGPGVTAEQDRTARSYSEGIGIEVWLPDPAAWNERIRNYGGGGWVGGGHRYADKIGSKVPALVNANMGYASGTTDAGQPWYQDASFTFLSNGAVNVEGFRDLTARAMYEQALKTQALVRLYYGRAQKFAYYDGHSQGGRQGLKVAQERPELYDGYMIGQPALSVPKFGLASLYPQIVMKSELGIDARNKPAATAYAKKVEAATARAVKACDKEGLGYLLDPFACGYSASSDAAALCTGVAGRGATGSNADTATCMSLREAEALDRIWNGPTADGGFDAAATPDGRSGKALAPKQLWWSLPRGASYGGQLTAASTDILALAMQDVSYSADAASASGIATTNTSTGARNRWTELTYASYADAFERALAMPILRDYMTDNADLTRLRDLGRKVIVWNGLAEDVIPPAGAVNWYEHVATRMGGVPAVQGFMRMYMIPGMAHSSQGRAWTVGGNPAAVPMPRLPGNANQNPTRAQDTLFSALVDWVERGIAPENIVIASRDSSVSYPICVYPKKIAWNGTGRAREAADYSCR